MNIRTLNMKLKIYMVKLLYYFLRSVHGYFLIWKFDKLTN